MDDRRRLKAVVTEDNSSASEDDEASLGEEDDDDGFEPEGLDLGLSLGRQMRRWAPASTSDGEDGMGVAPAFRALYPWNLSPVGGLQSHAGEAFYYDEKVEVAGGGSMERDGDGDRDRYFQYKRPKVVAYSDYNIATSSSVGEESGLPATMDNTYPCSLSKTNNGMIICPISNDLGARLRESTDGLDVQVDTSDTRNNEDAEIGMDLTEDLLLLVFSFLGQKDLCKAGATCKQWQAASMHEEFWRSLNFQNTVISQQNFDAICQRYPNATEVNLFGVHNSDVLVMGAMSSLRHLEILILGKVQFGDGFFHALTNCHALKHLSICDSSLGSGLQEIAVHHESLRKLQIMKCRVLRISVRCPQLQSLSLRRTTMANALLACPRLHEFDIASCHKLSDAGIRSAATTCPLLASLDMSSCSSVSDETLREIGFACPNLCVLDASYCPNISLEPVRLPMLIDLKLHSCEGITFASMSAISHSRMLEALQLDNCGLLTSVSLDLPHLRSISLVHCRKFVELILCSPVLTYIKVSNCSSLHHISITSNVLQKLVLQKQESLTTLVLQCPNLQEVDLSDCESLTDSICEVFSDGGGCPMLNSLSLDNCESLSLVRLNSSALVYLSLVGCRGMTALDLSCPNLQIVNLDGCDHLEKASFSPVGLESLNLGICPKLSILLIEAPRMLVLELKGCGVLSQASISCPCLLSMDASFCRQFMDDSLSTTASSCPHIESLILSSCVSVGYVGLSSLHRLQRLTLLDLSYTFLTNLQPVFDSCIQLVILKLTACKYLSNTSLDALYKESALPALRELDLSYSSIGQFAIAELLACCAHLVNVNLNGCKKMHDLILGSSNIYSSEMPPDDMCPSNSISVEDNDESSRKPEHLLEILNCTGCPNIKKVVIPSTARCFQLSKLNLNLSTNLKEVDIACFNLNSLNLSNCSSLEILKLDCPRLMNLQLLACSTLEVESVEAAISRCKMLETLNVLSCPKIHDVYVGRLRMACPSSSLKRIQCSLWV